MYGLKIIRVIMLRVKEGRLYFYGFFSTLNFVQQKNQAKKVISKRVSFKF